MDGSVMRAFREKRGENQTLFAEWLASQLGRKYDRTKVTKWETGAERIPMLVEDFLTRNGAVGTKLARRVVVAVANQKEVWGRPPLRLTSLLS
jgi:chromosome partitioning protein